MSKYLFRILAVGHFVYWLVICASMIGKQPTPIPDVWSWGDMWAPLLLIALSTWIGYQSGRETRHD